MMNFTETEYAILRVVQRDLPDTLTPYAAIGETVGTDEAVVLDLLRRMKSKGAIRRFGASVKHQKAGFTHNAMVAWIVAPAQMDEVGKTAAANENVSHCYYRPSCAEDWPYSLYTMVHARSEEECAAAIDALASIPCMGEHAVLTSLKELKKISMTYF